MTKEIPNKYTALLQVLNTDFRFAMRLLLLAIVVFLSLAQTQALFAQSSDFYPLDSVKPGQKGYGKTVFQDTKIERFGVEILGVLRNFGPHQNLILARLAGKQLERFGVFGGMSGSPIYLEDRLAGAVAYSYLFAKEPIAGITPIQEIVDVFQEKPKLSGFSGKHHQSRNFHQVTRWKLSDLLPKYRPPHFQVDSTLTPYHTTYKLRPIATPLSISSFSTQSFQTFASQFRELGFAPMQGAGSAVMGSNTRSVLEPGASISVHLVRGDIDLYTSGTLTHIDGKRLYAFGHPFTRIGYTDMPLSKAAVLTIISTWENSAKVSANLESIGSIKQDRATGVMGIIGEDARLIPVKLRLLTSRNELKEFNYGIINDSFLTPLLMALSVHNGLVASERSVGGQTLKVKCTISVKGQPQVKFEHTVSDLVDTATSAAVVASVPLNFLLTSGFQDLVTEKIDIEITSLEEVQEATLEKVWQDKVEVRVGEEVKLKVFLRKLNGDMVIETYPIKIPDGLPTGPLQILIGDGVSLTELDTKVDPDQFVPNNLGQLIKAINNLKKNNRLYIRLFRNQAGTAIGGERLPGLPPSLLALYNSKKTSGDTRSINKVIYMEHELPPTDFVLKGHTVIKVTIED